MIEFARNTPPEVADWFRAHLAARPDDAIVRGLATDERMSALWAEFDRWPTGALAVVSLAAHYSTPAILSNLQKTPEERIGLSWPESLLGFAADDLAVQLERWPKHGAELLGEPVERIRRASPHLCYCSVRASKGQAEHLR